MHSTIMIDDELLAKAQEYTGIKDISALLHEALKFLVVREAARRLSARGGSDPSAIAGPRRKSKPE
jgi:Arc/MetJ family transcription regulator